MEILKNKTIGFIGAGNMGAAIMSGLSKAGFKNIIVFDPNEQQIKKLDFPFSKALNISDVINRVDIVIVAIKPQLFEKVLSEYKKYFQKEDLLVISIAAGKTLDDIRKIIGPVSIARIMPNMAATIGESVSACCFNQHLDIEDKENVKTIFKTVGIVIEIAEEYFPIFTAIGGCSPAFTALYVDALAQSGVRFGLSKTQSLDIALQTIKGTVLLLEKQEKHPRVLIDEVASPGGTTVEGLIALQQNGFEKAISKAVEASYRKDECV